MAYSTASAYVYDFAPNTHIDIILVNGTFTSGAAIKGNTSSANWTVLSVNDTAYMNTAYEDVVDNQIIESESDGIIDFTETNPFGEP